MYIIDKQSEDDSPQAFTQNGSPHLNRAELPARPAQEAYDVILQRKENEGFGFVILTSKSKPPPGGKDDYILLYLPEHSVSLTLWNELRPVYKFSLGYIFLG